MYPGVLANFVAGAIAMGYVIVGLFFLRFWSRTGDRLFAIFAMVFWLLAANYAAYSLAGGGGPEPAWIYLIRLAAFALIIVGIIAKNLRFHTHRRPPSVAEEPGK